MAVTDFVTAPVGTDPRKVFDLLEHAAGRGGGDDRRGRHPGRRAQPHRGDPGRDLHPRRRQPWPAADRGGDRHQRRRRRQGPQPRRGRHRPACRRHRAWPSGQDARRNQGGVIARSFRAGGRGQRGVRRRHPRPDQRGRVHRQGRCRARRYVHHKNDDRRRSPAVLRRRRMRRRGKATRRTRVGRRWCPLSARRRAGAGGWSVERDDRVVVRGHLRVAGRPDARPRGPALQGKLRYGVQARGRGEDRRRQPVRPGA